MLLQQRTLMSNVVAALTPSPWDVWVEVKSCIDCIFCICIFEVYLYFYEAVEVSIIMLSKFDA
jgi:hypothetical protein